jgi:four helix bundle protein
LQNTCGFTTWAPERTADASRATIARPHRATDRATASVGERRIERRPSTAFRWLRLHDFAPVLARVQAAKRAGGEDAAGARCARSLDTGCARGRTAVAVQTAERQGQMLRIYGVILDFLERLVKINAQIARHDRDLARQLKRSSASVALNTAEGMYAKAGNRTAAYGVALREMRESFAALEIAVRLRYIAPLEPALVAECNRIIGTLVRLAFPAGR